MDLTPLATAFERETLALVRTDRSDDTAWASVLAAMSTPVDIVGAGDLDDLVAPPSSPIDDPAYDGATGASLAAAIQAAGGEPVGYAVLADAPSMGEARAGGEITLAYVDLSCPDPEEAAEFDTFLGRTFRCAVPEIASIEANLAIANMDFHEFADYADERDGTFRGFDSGD
ncbi:hypothetical protein H5V45_01915 [Nocardioides sp. KIGAM211]|uniref:DUF6924 domain-containing protein n=1 Tax=Nocardioides luti TaxID=2761101 RepID=A0A7X0V8Z6_9ACTN|nr:hypothetical protein [Nocardioides luti]MBB6626066.1 hypothetical protein [Nocardioides luti]